MNKDVSDDMSTSNDIKIGNYDTLAQTVV